MLFASRTPTDLQCLWFLMFFEASEAPPKNYLILFQTSLASTGFICWYQPSMFYVFLVFLNLNKNKTHWFLLGFGRSRTFDLSFWPLSKASETPPRDQIIVFILSKGLRRASRERPECVQRGPKRRSNARPLGIGTPHDMNPPSPSLWASPGAKWPTRGFSKPLNNNKSTKTNEK